jgi:carboxyl-terminal processing protease
MDKLGLEERFEILHSTFTYLDYYFVHWNYAPKGVTLEYLRKRYMKKLLAAHDRKSFSLLMAQMITELKNGHTWYTDTLLYKKERWPGFYAFYHDEEKKWVVSKSTLKDVMPGDIIYKVNGQTTEALFKKISKYICASSERAARNSMFLYYNWLPKKMSITTNKGTIHIDRTHTKKLKKEHLKTTSRLIFPDTLYLKIPRMHPDKFAEDAIKMIKTHKNCKNLILDLRGNPGGSTPRRLIRMLVKRRALGSMQLEMTQKTVSQILTLFYLKKGDKKMKYTSYTMRYVPFKNHYKGNLFVLVDQSTGSAAEDIVLPIKQSRSGTVIGVTTRGSDGSTMPCYSKNGIKIYFGVNQVRFPDGSRFEGIGIKPDITVCPTTEEIRTGNDPVLDKAIRLCKH